MFSLSPSVQVIEYDNSQFIGNLPSSKTGMVLQADTGPCNRITPITTEGELIKWFGKPTSANYQDWFQAWNFLQYASSLYVVRPMYVDATNQITVKNAGIGLTGETSTTISDQGNLYNTEVAELTLQSITSSNRINFYNRFITSKQDLAIGICSSPEYWKQSIATTFSGTLKRDATNASTINNVGGLTGSTASRTVNIENGNTLVANSRFLSTDETKIFTVLKVGTSSLQLDGDIVKGDVSKYYGTPTTTTIDTSGASGSTITIDFSLTERFNISENATFNFASDTALYYATSVTGTTTTRKVEFTKITGTGAASVTLPTTEISSCSENFFFTPSATYIKNKLVTSANPLTVSTGGGLNFALNDQLQIISENGIEANFTVSSIGTSGTITGLTLDQDTDYGFTSINNTYYAMSGVGNVVGMNIDLSPLYQTDYVFEKGTETIEVESGANLRLGQLLKFSPNDPISITHYTGLKDDVFPAEAETDVYSFEVIDINADTNTITIDRPLDYPAYVTSTYTFDDIITDAPILKGINLLSTVYDTSLISKQKNSYFNVSTQKSETVVQESLIKFSSLYDFEPNWILDEFLTVILKQNALGKYEVVEKKLASYREASKDVQGRNLFANEVFFYGSSYVYCKVNTLAEEKQKANTATTPLAKFVTDTGTIQPLTLNSPYRIIQDYGTVYPVNTRTLSNNDEILVLDKTLKPQYDATNYNIADIMNAADKFSDAESFDINILIENSLTGCLGIMTEIAESRRDCFAIVPFYNYTSIVGKTTTEATLQILNNFGTQTPSDTKIFTVNGTYSAMYGNMKYQYDKFNDVNRWIGVGGDIAGLYAQTDTNRDPWWAPAGLERGKIKNVIKLAFNPNKQNRDELYVNGINPIMSIAGEGAGIVFGQKTSTAKPSALDRINVRRLLITIEKAIASAAKYSIFEFNDAFTRNRLVGMIDPFLRTVKSRRGLYSYGVKCDGTNNTPAIIDQNALVLDIYVQPTKTCEFIQINVNIEKTGAVGFSESAS